MPTCSNKNSTVDSAIFFDDANRYYFSGYHSSFGMVLLFPQKGYYVTDSRYADEVSAVISIEFEVVTVTKVNAMAKVGELISSHGAKTLGYEDATTLHTDYLSLASTFQGVKLIPISEVIGAMRAVKSPEELATIKRATEISDKAILALQKFIKQGVTEKEVRDVKERGIPQSFMMEKIIQAITTAYKRDHVDVENVIVDVDEEHQTLTMYVQKNVVDEEDYVDPANEMTVEEAKKISARYEIGDIVNIPVDNTEFGRIAAGNGKQVIIQGLREAERGMVYDEFNSKQHEILTGVVTRIDPRNGNVSLRIGTGTESTEALLMAGEQVPGEELNEGIHIKV